MSTFCVKYFWIYLKNYNLKLPFFNIMLFFTFQVIDSIDFSGFDKAEIFVESIKKYDLIVRFTIEYNLKLPEMFLRMCAHNNLWLPFLIYAQLKNYPTEQIKIIVHAFKSPNLSEHILHSVMHDFQVCTCGTQLNI